MKRFLIIPNTIKIESKELTMKIISWLVNHGYIPMITHEIGVKFNLSEYVCNKDDAFACTDCVIVLGGDGTILSTAREIGQYQIPLLGVNLGHLGFLAEIDPKDVYETLNDIVSNHYIIDDRMMLQTKIIEKNSFRDIGLALNDIVVSRSSISRMLGYSIYVNNDLVNHYYADGVIISTPTGSTAYNLSAGGPILSPNDEMMVITPICPHSLTSRSIVISSNDQVRINFECDRSACKGDLQITVDGQNVIQIDSESEIVIQKASVYTHLIKTGNKDFFKLLRKKLGNG